MREMRQAMGEISPHVPSELCSLGHVFMYYQKGTTQSEAFYIPLWDKRSGAHYLQIKLNTSNVYLLMLELSMESLGTPMLIAIVLPTPRSP